MLSVLSIALVSLVSFSADEVKPLQVGESKSQTLNICFKSTDDKSWDKGLPEIFCVEDLSVVLHPANPFSAPKVNLKGTQNLSDLELTLEPSSTDSKSKKSLVKAYLIAPSRSDTGEDRLYRRSLELNFTLDVATGEISQSSVAITGRAQHFVNGFDECEYSGPDGEEQTIKYAAQKN